MTKHSWPVLVIVWSLWCSVCMGHGVELTVVLNGGTGVEARYDDGSPVSYSEVKVFSPKDPETEFQSGVTDKNGRFMFFPDTTGTWRVIVDDGMGHLLTAEVQAGPNKLAGGGDTRVSRLTGGIVGVSVIFGLFGIYCLAGKGIGQTKRREGRVQGDSSCTSPKA